MTTIAGIALIGAAGYVIYKIATKKPPRRVYQGKK